MKKLWFPAAVVILLGVIAFNLYRASPAWLYWLGIGSGSRAGFSDAGTQPAHDHSGLVYGLIASEPLPPGLSPLPRDGWAVEATHQGEAARLVLDGGPATAWQSGAPRRPGMAVRVDFPRPARVGSVELINSQDDVDDYPRSLALSASPDGARWETVGKWEWPPERRPSEGDNLVRLVFDPVVARSLRLELVADPFGEYSCGGWWWSIGEIKVYSDPGRR